MDLDEESSSSDDSVQRGDVIENEIDENERKRIREEVSNMSFEDLQKLKQKMGCKLYNKTLNGESIKKPKTDFKPKNKFQPHEQSSKIRPPEIKFSKAKVKRAKVVIPRDPRFDPLCGAFDKDKFKENYKFVNKIKMKEKEQLVKELADCSDPKRKHKIELLIKRIENQLREHEKEEVVKKKQKEEKKEIREKYKKGEKPLFKKKSQKKIENLVQQYEELKKTNRLEKHIKKRTKKMATKERRRQSEAVANY